MVDREIGQRSASPDLAPRLGCRLYCRFTFRRQIPLMPLADDTLRPQIAPPSDADLMRYCEFQYVFVQFITEHLVDCRKNLDGNLDDVLILAILGQSRIRAFLAASPSSTSAPGTITAARLADVSGIPRETVRRRLSALGSKGWITRMDDGSWCIAGIPGESPVRRDLAELDRRGMSRMLRFHADLSRLVARYEAPTG